MLVNLSSNQAEIANTVPIHRSLTSSSSSSSSSSASQGHEQDNHEREGEGDEEDEDEEAVQVNEDNIDDNQQSRQEDASSHNCNVVVPPLTQKKLKHFYSSSTLLPSNRPRSSTSTAAATMLRQHHPCHETYRTLQLPINASEKFLMVSPTGQHRSTLNTSAASENNLQRTNIRMYSATATPSNDETVRALSRGKTNERRLTLRKSSFEFSLLRRNVKGSPSSIDQCRENDVVSDVIEAIVLACWFASLRSFSVPFRRREESDLSVVHRLFDDWIEIKCEGWFSFSSSSSPLNADDVISMTSSQQRFFCLFSVSNEQCVTNIRTQTCLDHQLILDQCFIFHSFTLSMKKRLSAIAVRPLSESSSNNLIEFNTIRWHVLVSLTDLFFFLSSPSLSRDWNGSSIWRIFLFSFFTLVFARVIKQRTKEKREEEIFFLLNRETTDE